jgi:hypothetical protein
MAPTDRFVTRFAAEPPQEPLPYGRWADTLANHFTAAFRELDTEGEDLGELGEIAWFPDRTYGGRTYVPAVASAGAGYEVFGFVSFGEADGGPSDFHAHADFTSETAEAHPEWRLDLNEEVIGFWRGENGNRAEITLIWGIPLVPGGHLVTAELSDLAVDQCELMDQRFTLIGADAYRGDYLDIKLWDGRGAELARESLYVEEDTEEDTGRP